MPLPAGAAAVDVEIVGGKGFGYASLMSSAVSGSKVTILANALRFSSYSASWTTGRKCYDNVLVSFFGPFFDFLANLQQASVHPLSGG